MYEGELRKTREVLDTVEVAGYPRRDAEPAELRRLIAKHPQKAQGCLDVRQGRQRSLQLGCSS